MTQCSLVERTVTTSKLKMLSGIHSNTVKATVIKSFCAEIFAFNALQYGHVLLLYNGHFLFLRQVAMRLYPYIQHIKHLQTTFINAFLRSFRTFLYDALNAF